LIFNWIIYLTLECAVIMWLAVSIRKKMRHEMSASTGFLVLFTLFFHQWGHIFPIDRQVLVESHVLKITGFVLLGIAGVTAIATFLALRYRGKPTDAWENTTQLIEGGLFRFMRHPMYFAAFAATLGVLFQGISAEAVVLASIATPCFFLAAWFEDKWNEKKFGDVYKQYQRKTKRFLPFVW
jgi:protein-S-isoprenylcysteine O-methyltransferase Ste14